MKRIWLALAATLALMTAALAATTTSLAPLQTSTYTDLGAGPIALGAYGGAVVYQISDTQPTAGAGGLVVQPGAPAVVVGNAASHVWAFSPTPNAAAVVTTGGGAVAATLDVSNATHAPQYCQITVTTTATSLASLLATAGCAAIPSWATVAYVTPEVSNTIALRWRADGTNPTASVGWPVFGYSADSSILGYNAVINAVLISATGGSATVSVRIAG